MTETEPCRLGYEEHDGSRYCFAHGGFAHYLIWGTLICDRKPTYRRALGSDTSPGQ